MQTNKHTSGPWFRTVSQDNGETIYEICTAAENGEPKEMIARVNHCVITPGLAISDEVRANARLIAAAPDLLAALERIMHQAENGLNPGGNIYLQLNLIKALSQDAVAKAKGDA
jgi:hypothetical protein